MAEAILIPLMTYVAGQSGAMAAASIIDTMGPILSTAAVGAQVAGTIMSASSARQAGEAQQEEANYQATQMRQNANNAEATAEEKMVQQNKETEYALSNAKAAAAAGGGSATDPTVTTNMMTIAGQGRFRALTDMYEGDAAAQADKNQAAATQYGGVLAADAGNTKMYTNILSGASSLYNKYGNPKSDVNTNTNPPWVQ